MVAEGLERNVREGSASFLEKRSKKLLILKGWGWQGKLTSWAAGLGI
jgi:hypothetical protein